MRTITWAMGMVTLFILAALVSETPAQNQPPARSTPKKKEQNARRQDRLPIARSWDVAALQDLGEIVETRNEAATKDRVVWIIEAKTRPPADLYLQPQLCDDDGGIRYRCDQLEINVLKKEKAAKATRLEIIMKMPPKNQQQGVYKVVIRKLG